MRNFIVILFLVIASTQIRAAGSYTDLFHIGKVGTTANSVLEIGDIGEFRYDFGNSKMQFSHDGTNFYDVIGPNDTVTLENKSFDVSSNTLTNVVVTNLAAGVLDTDLTSVSASDDTLGSAKAIKTYVDAEIIANSVPTLAKGGLITHSTVNVAQAVGANGQVLTADSGVTNGIKWATPSVADHTISSPSVLTQKTISSLSNTITNINTGDFQAGAIDTDLTSVSASDNTLASAKAIKTYVDANTGGSTVYNSSIKFSLFSIGSGLVYSPTVTIVSTGSPIEVGFTDSEDLTPVSSIRMNTISGGQLVLKTRIQMTSPSSFDYGEHWLSKETGVAQNLTTYYSCSAIGVVHIPSPPVGSVTFRGAFFTFREFSVAHIASIRYCKIYVKII